MQKAYKIGGILLLLVLVTTGCGQSAAEKIMENNLEDAMGGQASVDMEDGSLKVETVDGVSLEVGEDVSIPADFPEDIYVVEGEVVSVMKNVVGAGTSLAITTDKTIAETKTLYEEKLVEEGWTITANMALGEAQMFVANKDNEDLNISISIDEDGEKTMVVLSVMQIE